MGIEQSLSTEIEWKQLICYGQVQRIPDARLPKITVIGCHQVEEKQGVPKDLERNHKS